jgi:hypothetical protein
MIEERMGIAGRFRFRLGLILGSLEDKPASFAHHPHYAPALSLLFLWDDFQANQTIIAT